VNSIRVTGGCLKGRPIFVPNREAVRYTPAKVREALFNLAGPLEGSAFLDLFAGSGAVSIEALSRGALSATLVERDRGMCAVIRENLTRMGLLENSTILNMDVSDAIAALHRKGLVYDIIFMDPPYERGEVMKTLEILAARSIYRHSTLLLVEHSKRESAGPPGVSGFQWAPSRRYGDTSLTVFRAQQTSFAGRTEWQQK
jgi:16S rRNA (guanine966-N2)-methyltransferase